MTSNRGSAPLPPTLPAGSYRLDPERTTIRGRFKANWGLMSVKATFRLKAGEFVVGDDPTRSSVWAVIDAASFDSRNAKRDQHVKSADFLDVATYPEFSFKAEGCSQDGGVLVMRGTLTAHGNTDPVELRIVRTVVKDGLGSFEATAEFDRTRLGVSNMVPRIGRAVKIAISATSAPT